MPVSPVVYCVRHQLFSDFCFIENISEFRYITTSFSGIKQLQNALCPFLKYFVFRSLGYTRNAHQPKRIVYNSDYKDTNFYKNGSGSSINSTSLWKVSLYQTGSNVSG